MARKQYLLFGPPLGNIGRKQCFLVCPPLRKPVLETMFSGAEDKYEIICILSSGISRIYKQSTAGVEVNP